MLLPAPTIIYHAADLDGKCSAAIALLAMRDQGFEPVLIPMDYGWVPSSLDGIPEGSQVYLLDFTFPPDYMRALAQRTELTWIDHHTPIIRECEAARIPALCASAILSDHQPSACLLTWRTLHCEGAPEVVALIDAWDSTPDAERCGEYWEHTIRPAQYGLRLAPRGPSSSEWKDLFYDGAIAAGAMRIIIRNGSAICQYIDETTASLVPRQAYPLQLHLPHILVTDPPADPASDINRALRSLAPMRALLWNHHPADPKDLLRHPDCAPDSTSQPHVLITWGYEGKTGLWRLSLSPGPAAPDLDCGRIAQATWGGGGHPGRAGSTFKHLPQELLPYPAFVPPALPCGQ
jgi:hypothetical protein